MKFKHLYRRIIEEEDIFKASTPEEGKKRKEIFDKMQFQEWINKFKRSPGVEQRSDGTWDVYRDVSWPSLNLKSIPLRFNHIEGHFIITDNDLTSLEGSPKTIKGSFLCGLNKLTTLKGCPIKVGRYFDCQCNFLTSLKDGPVYVGSSYNCHDNKLTSLEGAPRNVKNYFTCSSNELTDLVGSPSKIGHHFDCSFNKLTSLKGCPTTVEGNFVCFANPKEFTKEEILKVCYVGGAINNEQKFQHYI